jgi:hypothetical protein
MRIAQASRQLARASARGRQSWAKKIGRGARAVALSRHARASRRVASRFLARRGDVGASCAAPLLLAAASRVCAAAPRRLHISRCALLAALRRFASFRSVINIESGIEENVIMKSVSVSEAAKSSVK